MAMTSAGQLSAVIAKQGDLWEPTTEEELDQLEEEGLQLAMLQPHTVAMQDSLALSASVRCGWYSVLLQLYPCTHSLNSCSQQWHTAISDYSHKNVSNNCLYKPVHFQQCHQNVPY